MRTSNDRLRIVIAVTESCPVRELWKAAMQNASGSDAELVALFVADERWHRAASLPFTREISRVNGSIVDFTGSRAEQLVKDAVSRAQRQIEKLASEAELAFVFRVLSESEPKQIQRLIGDGQILLIAPSFLTSQPIYAHLKKLECRIELIETMEENHESQ